MRTDNRAAVFGTGAAVGALGGLIGPGGAEFRLPILIGAWIGADWATRLNSGALHRIIALPPAAIAPVVAEGHDPSSSGLPLAAEGFGNGPARVPSGRCRGRTSDPDAHFAGWRRRQTGRQPVAGRQPAYNDCGVCRLRPRQKLLRDRIEPVLRGHDGGGFGVRRLHWRTIAGHHLQRRVAAFARGHPYRIGNQDVAVPEFGG